MKKSHLLKPFATAALTFLSSCRYAAQPMPDPPGGNEPVPMASRQPPAWHKISYWDDDGSPGAPWMLVDLGRQVVTFFRGENRIGVAAISSGTEERQTPAGEYRILEKLRDKYSTSYGHVEDSAGRVVNDDATPRSPVPPGCRYVPAPMPFWMRLTSGGVGMHQGFLPGYAASHGCIRMDRSVVQHFFNAAHVGMRVKVVR